MNEPSFVVRFVDRLVFALVHAQLYGPNHPRVVEASADAARALGSYGAARDVGAVVLGVVDGQVVFEGRPMLGASLFAKRLLERIRVRGSGGLELLASVQGADLAGLVAALAQRTDVPLDPAAATRDLHARGVVGIRFLPPFDATALGGSGGASVALMASAVSLHQSTVDLLQGVTISVCQGHDIDLVNVTEVVDGILGGLAHDAGALHALAHYPEHDFYTFGHSIRVGLLALDVGRMLTRDVGLLQRIGVAALLHDVGKALVPWEVLHKRGRLTPDERQVMERHPVLGAGVLLANRDSDPLAVAAAYGHHHTADGGGYPRSCGEFHQATITRLVKICDVYEALTAVRPYKPALSPARAHRMMLDMKGHFDPDLHRRFVHAVGLFPAGTRVRLDDGSVARVVRQTADLHRPVVEVEERLGEPVAEGDRRPLDLTAGELGGPTLVRETVRPAEPLSALV